jgi:hypothetical protein
MGITEKMMNIMGKLMTSMDIMMIILAMKIYRKIKIINQIIKQQIKILINQKSKKRNMK